MDARLNDPDWETIFKEYVNPPAHVRRLPVETTYAREDVRKILAIEDGENDGPCWLGVFKMRDGKFLAVRAGCDYTGWDCQAGGHADLADTHADVVALGLTLEERTRLGLRVSGKRVLRVRAV